MTDQTTGTLEPTSSPAPTDQAAPEQALAPTDQAQPEQAPAAAPLEQPTADQAPAAEATADAAAATAASEVTEEVAAELTLFEHRLKHRDGRTGQLASTQLDADGGIEAVRLQMGEHVTDWIAVTDIEGPATD